MGKHVCQEPDFCPAEDDVCPACRDTGDGGPAFPYVLVQAAGMSLRDYFAAQALVGILGARQGFLIDVGTDNAPGWAYRIADAMLAERNK